MIQKYIVLLQLQMKSAVQFFPKMLTGVCLFSIVIGLMVTGAVTLSEKSEQSEKMRVAVVIDAWADEQETDYVKMAFSMLQEVPSVNNACAFITESSKQNAIQNLKDGMYHAVILIPKGFVSGILYGKNIPATVLFPKGMTSLSGFLIRELMQAGASDLGVAQAGIYAVEQVMDMHPEWTAGQDYKTFRMNTEEALNKVYFRSALERGNYFHKQIIYSRGNITIHQFYLATVICLLLLLLGIPCVSYFKKDKEIILLQLHRAGIPQGMFAFIRTISISCILTAFTGWIYVFGLLATIRYPQLRQWLYVPTDGNIIANVCIGIMGLFVVILTIYQRISLLYTWIKQDVSAVLVLFLLTVTGAYAGGLLLPISMLPEFIRNISNFLPIQWSFRLVTQIIIGQIQWNTIGVNAGIAFVCYLLTCFIMRMRFLRES